MTRKLILPNNIKLLISDTVGFIRKLPHHLIDSFRATFEESATADLLVHGESGEPAISHVFSARVPSGPAPVVRSPNILVVFLIP